MAGGIFGDRDSVPCLLFLCRNKRKELLIAQKLYVWEDFTNLAISLLYSFYQLFA